MGSETLNIGYLDPLGSGFEFADLEATAPVSVFARVAGLSWWVGLGLKFFFLGGGGVEFFLGGEELRYTNCRVEFS